MAAGMFIHNEGHFKDNNGSKGRPGENIYKWWLKAQGISYKSVAMDRECQKKGYDFIVDGFGRVEIKTNYKYDLQHDLVFIEDWSQITPSKPGYDTCSTKGCHSTFCQKFNQCYRYAVKGWWYTTQADYIVFVDKLFFEMIVVPMTQRNKTIYECSKNNFKIKYQNNYSRSDRTKLRFKSAGRLFDVRSFEDIVRINLFEGEHR